MISNLKIIGEIFCVEDSRRLEIFDEGLEGTLYRVSIYFTCPNYDF